MESSAGIAAARPVPGELRRVAATIGVVLAAAACGALAVASGSLALRAVVAAACAALLLALFEHDRVQGVLAAICFATVMEAARRMLIPAAGWASSDPIVLVLPFAVAVMLVRLFVVERRRLVTGTLSGMVCALLALVLLEAVNPRNGSLLVGAGGVLFLGAPLAWFFLGREVIGPGALDRLMLLTVGLGSFAAVYGLIQVWGGLPSWDAAWASGVQYNALSLGNGAFSVFGTFASSAEFSVFVGMATAVAVAFGISGRPSALIALAVTLPALALSSNRTAVVLCVVASVAMVVMRVLPARVVPLALVVCVTLTVAAAPAISALSRSGAESTANSRIQYQLSGIGSPVNGPRSTVGRHWLVFTNGVRRGLIDPFGAGTGSVNRASSVLGGGSEGAAAANTEIDVSNAFVALGLAGGVLYLALIVVAFRGAARNFMRAGDAASLAVIGALVTALGGWLSGGHYAAAPLVWLMLGATAARAETPRLRAAGRVLTRRG